MSGEALAPLQASLSLPYKLTTGGAASRFLAELAGKKIVGSRCERCARVVAPAQDVCTRCGGDMDEFVEVPATGTLTGFTETEPGGVVGTIRLDGTDGDFVHRLPGASLGELELGARVEAVWADEATGSILDLAGFRVVDTAPAEGSTAALGGDGAEPIPEIDYKLELDFEHAYGPFYGRLFDELKDKRRILGVKCPSCQAVLVPPREYCDRCFVKTAQWVDVSDEGTLKAFSVIHLKFVGQTREPPYVYAEIVLDGCNTRLIHTLGEIDADKAPEILKPGMHVKAVWRDGEPTGTLEDVEHFVVTDLEGSGG